MGKEKSKKRIINERRGAEQEKKSKKQKLSVSDENMFFQNVDNGKRYMVIPSKMSFCGAMEDHNTWISCYHCHWEGVTESDFDKHAETCEALRESITTKWGQYNLIMLLKGGYISMKDVFELEESELKKSREKNNYLSWEDELKYIFDSYQGCEKSREKMNGKGNIFIWDSHGELFKVSYSYNYELYFNYHKKHSNPDLKFVTVFTGVESQCDATNYVIDELKKTKKFEHDNIDWFKGDINELKSEVEKIIKNWNLKN